MAVRKGYRVIPQLYDKSIPFKWKPYQERPPTDDELRQWAMDYPNALWAALTGQESGVIVFDFDGNEGLATMRRLRLTPTFTTPSGEAHVHCRAPDFPVRGAARVDQENFPNMDLQADGQLATFYGTNRLAGGSYEKAGRKAYLLDDLPVDLQRLLTERHKTKPRKPVELPAGFSDFADGDALLREAVKLVESALPVQRRT